MLQLFLNTITYKNKPLVQNFIGCRNLETDAVHSIAISNEDAMAILNVVSNEFISDNGKVIDNSLLTITTLKLN